MQTVLSPLFLPVSPIATGNPLCAEDLVGGTHTEAGDFQPCVRTAPPFNIGGHVMGV